jgi:CubicO group peptidase (beta-lactamase class C family)
VAKSVRFFFVVVASWLAMAPAQKTPVFPGADWEHARSPEAAGFSARRLAAVRESLRPLATTSMVVVASGRIVLEYGDTAEISYVASVRKSILGMLFGKYVEGGTIRLDKTLAELKITDHGGLSPQELEATVADLLAARSGVYHPASNPGDSLAYAPPRGSKKHGTYFLYSNWDFNALGTIFEQETGRNIYDALDTDLARPIGMQDFDRKRHEKSGDLTRSVHPAYHIHLSTRDMARVGYLMLREGRWGERQVVPKAWVRRMVTPVTRNTEMNPGGGKDTPFGYGLLWWVLDGRFNGGGYAGAYTAIGALGQYITVLPRYDLVVAHKVKPGSGGDVTAAEYFTVVDNLLAARS